MYNFNEIAHHRRENHHSKKKDSHPQESLVVAPGVIVTEPNCWKRRKYEVNDSDALVSNIFRAYVKFVQEVVVDSLGVV